MERIEIYSSKKKSMLLLIGSIAFVVLGFWLLLEADNLTGWRARNPIFTRGIGIASILFFGLGVFVGVKRLGESGIRTRGPKILNHKLNIIPKSTAFEISNLGFMAFPAGIYNKIVDGNQTFQLYYPI